MCCLLVVLTRKNISSHSPLNLYLSPAVGPNTSNLHPPEYIMPLNTFQLTSVDVPNNSSIMGGAGSMGLDSGSSPSRPMKKKPAAAGGANVSSTSSSSSHPPSKMSTLLQVRRETELKITQLKQAILALEEDAYVVGVVAPDREVSSESTEMMTTVKTLLHAMETKKDDITHEISCHRMKKHDDAEAKQIALEDKLRTDQENAMKRAMKHAADERKMFVLERASKNQQHQETVEKIREKLHAEAMSQFSLLQKAIKTEEAKNAEKQRKREEAKNERMEAYWQKDQERNARRIALEEKRAAEFEKLVAPHTVVVRPASTSPQRGGAGKQQQHHLPPRAITSLDTNHSSTNPSHKAPHQKSKTLPKPTTTTTKKKKSAGVADYDVPRRGPDLEAVLDREDSKHLKLAKEECDRIRMKFITKNAQREHDAAEKLDGIRQRKLNSIEAMYARRTDVGDRLETLRRIQRSELDKSAQERDERAAEAKVRAAYRKVDNRWLKRAQALVSTVTAATEDE